MHCLWYWFCMHIRYCIHQYLVQGFVQINDDTILCTYHQVASSLLLCVCVCLSPCSSVWSSLYPPIIPDVTSQAYAFPTTLHTITTTQTLKGITLKSILRTYRTVLYNFWSSFHIPHSWFQWVSTRVTLPPFLRDFWIRDEVWRWRMSWSKSVNNFSPFARWSSILFAENREFPLISRRLT